MSIIRIIVWGLFFHLPIINGMELDLSLLDLNLSWHEAVLKKFKYHIDKEQYTDAMHTFNAAVAATKNEHSGCYKEDLCYATDKNGDSFLHVLSSVSLASNEAFSGAFHLMNAGCPVDIKNNEGKTPLHLAVNVGYEGLCELLLTKKNGLLEERDNNGRFPLHIAALNRSPMMIDWLMSHGSDHLALANDNNGQSSAAILLGLASHKQLASTAGQRSWKLDKDIFASLTNNMDQEDIEVVKQMVLEAKKEVKESHKRTMYDATVPQMNAELKRLRSSAGEGKEDQQKTKRARLDK